MRDLLFDPPRPTRWARVVLIAVLQGALLASAYAGGWHGALDDIERRLQATSLTT